MWTRGRAKEKVTKMPLFRLDEQAVKVYVPAKNITKDVLSAGLRVAYPDGSIEVDASDAIHFKSFLGETAQAIMPGQFGVVRLMNAQFHGEGEK